VITAESLHLASLSANAEVQRLCMLVEQSAAALATAELRATAAEQALKRAKQRQAKLKTAPADLTRAARAHLDKIDSITTEQFQCGAERETREALRAVLEAIEANDG
jgi:hypothetical protein